MSRAKPMKRATNWKLRKVQLRAHQILDMPETGPREVTFGEVLGVSAVVLLFVFSLFFDVSEVLIHLPRLLRQCLE